MTYRTQLKEYSQTERRLITALYCRGCTVEQLANLLQISGPTTIKQLKNWKIWASRKGISDSILENVSPLFQQGLSAFQISKALDLQYPSALKHVEYCEALVRQKIILGFLENQSTIAKLAVYSKKSEAEIREILETAEVLAPALVPDPRQLSKINPDIPNKSEKQMSFTLPQTSRVSATIQ